MAARLQRGVDPRPQAHRQHAVRRGHGPHRYRRAADQLVIVSVPSSQRRNSSKVICLIAGSAMRDI
jgi:hypothetical protein